MRNSIFLLPLYSLPFPAQRSVKLKCPQTRYKGSGREKKEEEEKKTEKVNEETEKRCHDGSWLTSRKRLALYLLLCVRKRRFPQRGRFLLDRSRFGTDQDGKAKKPFCLYPRYARLEGQGS